MVRGRQHTMKTASATTLHTIVQVACCVMTLRAMVNVKMWLALVNINKMTRLAPNTSRPMGPHRTSPASARLST